MSSPEGLPLLSGSLPEYNLTEASCRKCDKEFNVLFTRPRKCNHCGYSYCHSCTDFQALMPRTVNGQAMGYDMVPVCAFCIENLNITASGKGKLRQLPMSKLKKYAGAYGIKVNGVIEKDDFIDTLIAARLSNGCLPSTNEEVYRKYAVPNRMTGRPRGLFSRAMDAVNPERSQAQPPPQQRAQQPPYQARQRTTSGPSSFPRPDLDPRRQARAQPRSTPRAQSRPPPRAQPTAPRPQPRPNLNVPNRGPSRARAASASASSSATPRAPSPAPPVPSLDELLEMPAECVATLSIGTLKAVLFQNHVNARLVVEKEELVAKVRTLIEDERTERGRHAHEEAAERAMEEARRQRDAETAGQGRARAESEDDEDEVLAQVLEESRRMAEQRAEEEQHGEPMDVDEEGPYPREEVEGSAARHTSAASAPVTPPRAPSAAPAVHTTPATSPPTPHGTHAPPTNLSAGAQAMASRLERTGLCVICQDEEANIAIVDCGHLAMCRACADLIMKSTRECPLCRTRIVTEQRLLRIFKT